MDGGSKASFGNRNARTSALESALKDVGRTRRDISTSLDYSGIGY